MNHLKTGYILVFKCLKMWTIAPSVAAPFYQMGSEYRMHQFPIRDTLHKTNIGRKRRDARLDIPVVERRMTSQPRACLISHRFQH